MGAGPAAGHGEGHHRRRGRRGGADAQRGAEAGHERGGRLPTAVGGEDAGEDGDAEHAAELAHGGGGAGGLALLGGAHGTQQHGLERREHAGGAEADRDERARHPHVGDAGRGHVAEPGEREGLERERADEERARPSRSDSAPATGAVTIIAVVIGSRRRPAPSGVAPSPVCMSWPISNSAPSMPR